jgi:hypothetical protein
MEVNGIFSYRAGHDVAVKQIAVQWPATDQLGWHVVPAHKVFRGESYLFIPLVQCVYAEGGGVWNYLSCWKSVCKVLVTLF